MTDLLVVVLIADAAQNALADDYRSLPDAVLLVAVVVFWAWALDLLGFRFPVVERLLQPPKLPPDSLEGSHKARPAEVWGGWGRRAAHAGDGNAAAGHGRSRRPAAMTAGPPSRVPLRARWIAFRTLRQHVEPTGETVEGHPVYVAGGVRLVLPDSAHHFRVLHPCALCGKEMTGRAVLHPSGLGTSADQHMCLDCSAGAAGGR